ncbi:MAG TPA: ABC transporter permease [Candidatus Dormibacteraeota bacterium]|nr:ABC transporter permease [Candidatus Dormibacteraeota bacterium]
MSVESATVTAPAPGGQPVALRIVRGRQLVRELLRDRTAVAGAVIVVLFALIAILGPWLAHQDPNAVDVTNALAAPSRAHLFGTDELGRDIFTRILFGARTSIGSVVIATAIISVIGLTVGTIAGYVGGVVDAVVSWVINVLLAFPSFLLALAVAGILGASLVNVLVAIVVAWWPVYARIARGAVLVEREKAYVGAAEGLGASRLRIVGRHLLPNIVAPIVVLTTLDMGTILLGISSLSFLGLGVSPPAAEWGSMLSEGKDYISVDMSIMIFPGLAIFLLVLGFNLLGDGLRDLLDPRTRRVR